MAALNQTPYFNDALIAPTATERAQIQDTSTGLVGAVSPVWTCDLANCPAPLQLSVPDASASSSSYGGSMAPEELGKIVGVDLGDPGFWDGGLDIIERLLVDTEEAAAAAGRV